MLKQDKSILLVEDNPDDELLTVRALNKLDRIKVTVAESGTEALNLLFNNQDIQDPQHSKVPDLVLLDLNLPVVDGLTVLKKIRSDERTKKIPVIVLTSSGEEKDIRESYELGANSYIRKPVDFLEFKKIANLIGEYWLMLNISPSATNS